MDPIHGDHSGVEKSYSSSELSTSLRDITKDSSKSWIIPRTDLEVGAKQIKKKRGRCDRWMDENGNS
jgi:hypothetical protein